MAAWLDAVLFNPTLGGTTDWVVSAAVQGYQTPAGAGAVDGRTYKYRAESADLSQWEIGEGVYTSGTTTLSRTTVYYNSAGTTAKINFTVAPKVGIVALKSDLISIEEANIFTATQKAQARSNIGIESGTGLYNFSLDVSAAGSALTIALKDAAGNNPSSTSPVVVDFRSATLTSSVPTSLAVTAATSLVLSSGSTLGVTSSTGFRLWVVGFNDAGTFRLGVINCAKSRGVYPLNETALASSTAEGGAGAADSAGVFYTGTAVSSKAFRILGYIEWSASGLTAGTWTTTNLLAVQLFGPGVKKPGDVVQRDVNTTAQAAVNCTSTSFADSTHTLSMTPTSAANMIEVELEIFAYPRSAASQQNFVRIVRDAAVDISFIQFQPFHSDNGQYIFCGVMRAADRPNKATSASYVPSYRNSTTGLAQFSFNGLTLREIMS